MSIMVAISQWSSGISLTWALISLAVGGAITVVIAVRLWRDQRKLKSARQSESEGED